MNLAWLREITPKINCDMSRHGRNAGYRRAADLFFALAGRERLDPEQRRRSYKAAKHEALNNTNSPKLWTKAALSLLPFEDKE